MWCGCCVTLLTILVTLVASDNDCSFGRGRCEWGPWRKWSSCSKSCGSGTRSRSRAICCKVDESYDSCIKDCGLEDESAEQEPCEMICPAGNCTYETITDSGIEATDYTTLLGPGNLILNPPLRLLSDRDYCETSCQRQNLANGMYCWAFTFSGANNCHLYFYTKPLTYIGGNNGTSPGASVKVRRCTGVTECLATSADIVFVIDSSGSIGGENFGKIKDFVYTMVNRLDIDPDLTRVGVLVFSDAPKWYFKLGDYSSKLDVEKAIMRIPYIPGSTQTSKAMETLINEGFQLNRSAVPAIAVVITDGLSRYPSLTRVRAEILRKMGVRVYAIGVGNNTNHEELFNMASVPEDRYLYEFSSFDDLTKVSLDVNYVNCKETTTPTMTTEEPQTTATVSECVDTVDCLPYGMDMCTDYAPWAGSHCPLFCGFCSGPTTSAAPCVDAINNCASFGAYVCTDKTYIAWAQTNCRKFCEICTASTTSELPPTTPTTTPVPICEDTIDNCAGYKPACADPKFRGFLGARCPATCGFCQSYQIVNETIVNGLRCPDWNVPVECTLVAEVPGCCPLPRCPRSDHVYTVTAEKVFP